jgi:hypothetical protein
MTLHSVLPALIADCYAQAQGPGQQSQTFGGPSTSVDDSLHSLTAQFEALTGASYVPSAAGRSEPIKGLQGGFCVGAEAQRQVISLCMCYVDTMPLLLRLSIIVARSDSEVWTLSAPRGCLVDCFEQMVDLALCR